MDLEREVLVLQSQMNWVTHLVRSLAIVQDGIQELEGVHLQIYSDADKHVKHRAKRFRMEAERAVERAEIERQIEELKRKLEDYPPC